MRKATAISAVAEGGVHPMLLAANPSLISTLGLGISLNGLFAGGCVYATTVRSATKIPQDSLFSAMAPRYAATLSDVAREGS